jgi:hypothetical protein
MQYLESSLHSIPAELAINMLSHETPDLISLQLWPLNSLNHKPIDNKVWRLFHDSVIAVDVS